MVTRYMASLDGLPLHDIDPTIYITDIQEQAPQMNVVTHPRAAGHGMYRTRHARESVSVVIRFSIREYSTARRKAVLEQVIAWARDGGSLEINDRPGQALRVVLDVPPTITSSLHWTQELSMTLTAYDQPYWFGIDSVTVPANGDALLFVPGNAPEAAVDAEITATAGTVTLAVGNTAITLEDVSGDISIDHVDGILRITSGGESILHKRTPESSDDLLAIPGRGIPVYISGGTATVTARGAWV